NGGIAIHRVDGLILVSAEPQAQGLAKVRIVIHDQYLFYRHSCSSPIQLLAFLILWAEIDCATRMVLAICVTLSATFATCCSRLSPDGSGSDTLEADTANSALILNSSPFSNCSRMRVIMIGAFASSVEATTSSVCSAPDAVICGRTRSLSRKTHRSTSSRAR